MEHDHRVVERVAQDGEQRGDGVRRDLAAHEHVHAQHDDQVVQQGDNRRHAHLRIAEAHRDVGDDEQQRHEERDAGALDDAGAPVRADGGHLEAFRIPTELVGNLVGRRGRAFRRRIGGAHEEARLAIGVGGLHHGIGLAGIGEGRAHLLGGGVVAALMERDRGAAHELDAEVHAAHADERHDQHDRHGRDGQEHLAIAQQVDVELDEAAAHVMTRGSGLLALEVRGGLLAVLHAPESGVLGDALRGQQADDGRFEQQHHDDVADDAKRQRQAEALDRGACQEEQRERRDHGDQVGIDGREDAMTHAGDGGSTDAAAHANLLAEALKGKDGGVGSHADGQHDAGDACHGQAEQAEVRKQGQDAQVQHGEHGHGGSGDQAQALVEHQQIQHDQRKANGGNQHAGGQRVLAERRTDHLGLRVLEAHGQRAGLEHRLHGGGGFLVVAAGDGDLAAGDLGLHGRRGLHFAVKDDDDLALGACQVLRGVGERLRALGIKGDVDRIVGAGLGGAADIDLRDIAAGDQRRVGALLHRQMLGLAGRQLVAEVVGDGAIGAVLPVLDLGLDILIGERIQACELQLAGFADGGQRRLRIGKARDLHEDLVGALQLHHGLGGTERVDALLDDGARLLHVLGSHSVAVGAFRRQHHRQAALDVQALVDLVLRRGEHEDGPQHQDGGQHQQPYVAAIGVAALLLGLGVLRFRHASFS